MRPRLKEATFKKLSFEESSNLEAPFSLAEIKEDTIIMGEANRENIWSIKAILCDFKFAYGLSVNFYKRKIHKLNLDSIFLEATPDFLSCSIIHLPFPFLGFPIGANP